MAGIGSAPGIIVGVGVGAAASAALEPALEIPKQEAWARNANRILVPTTLAALVAQGGLTLDSAHASALRDGYTSDKLDALVYLSQTVPGIGEATNLWRKGLLSSDLYTHALTKSGLDQRYVAPIVANKTAEILGIGDLAYAVVRGLVPAPSWVPVAPPASGDKVPRFPVVDMDVIAEAAKLGYDETMFQILVGRSGLSMAPIMAANALFRGVIGPNDYLLAIAEGDLRTEWAEAVRETARQILTAGQYAELQLRGFLTADQRRAQTARHGMSDADSDLLYDVLGRSIPVHQITTGLARGGVFNGATDAIPAEYLQSLQRGNLRPEYYSLAYANRYSYPSAFVIRALATGGELDEPTTRQVLLDIGWPPALVDKVLAAWFGSTSTGGGKHLQKAQTKAWTEAQSSYIAQESSAADVQPIFTALGVDQQEGQQIVALWDQIRALRRKQLSPAQVKKAYAEGVPNPATGLPWSLTDATSALLDRGYSPEDAATLLAE